MSPISPRIQAISNSRSDSPNARRASGRNAYERSEVRIRLLSACISHATQKSIHERYHQLSHQYMITYPNTPPHSGSQPSSSSHRGHMAVQQRSLSPLQPRTYVPLDMVDAPSVMRSITTSPLELILSSCEPSLLHIAPILYDLGIQKMEHLRAVNRLSEETRDREVKEHALKMGVTVMEWAILLDKLQTL